MRIVIIGIQRLLGKFIFAGKTFPHALRMATMEAVLYTLGNIPPYPPAPPGSTYIRTGLLGRSLTGIAGFTPHALSRVDDMYGSVRGVVGTSVEYAKWVIDENNQAWMHDNNGWWTLQEVVRNLRPEIVGVYKKSLKAWLKSVF